MRHAGFALLLFAAGCSPPQEGQPVVRTELDGRIAPRPTASAEPLLAVDSACESVTFEGTPLVHCVADPARHRITTALGPAGGKPFRSLAAYAANRPADAPPVVFAMNAGMFDAAGEPIGYYVSGGERLHELNRADGKGNFHLKPNGVFYGGDGDWHVKTADAFYREVKDRPVFGTQSGPMLVIGGQLHPEFAEDGTSLHLRNGVGVDGEGRAHFVVSDEPLSFGRLARYFRDELACADALYLDGSVSGLWDPARGRLDSGAPLGPLLVVERREGGAR